MKTTPTTKKTEMQVSPIKLKIVLEDTPIEIYRKILVPENINMLQLHFVVQIAMGWEMSHLFQFADKKYNSELLVTVPYDDGDDYDSQLKVVLPEKALLNDYFLKVRNSKPFYYTYDFGDDWTHKITFQKPSKADLVLFAGIPLLVEASGACPPEDVGGSWGYGDFLEAINDKKHPEHKDFREWIGLKKGEIYDDELVDLEGINEALNDLPKSPLWKVSSKKYFEG